MNSIIRLFGYLGISMKVDRRYLFWIEKNQCIVPSQARPEAV
jgi:hypothetical protein